MYRLRRLFSAGGMVRPLLRLADGADGAGGGGLARVRASAGFKALRRGGPAAAGRHVGSGDRGPGGHGLRAGVGIGSGGAVGESAGGCDPRQDGVYYGGGGQWGLCAFNLLPVRPLDGGRALYLLLAWLAGPGTAEWGCRWVGISTALAAASGTAWLVWRTGGSLWLLPAVMGLLLAGVGWRNDR